MPKTQSRYQQDLGFTDARLFVGPGDVVSIQSGGTVALTRNGVADVSFNLSNSSTGIFMLNVSQAIIRRTGFGEDLMEQYGGSGIPASAQVQLYRPDVIPGMNTGQQLQPRTAFKVKGYKLLSMDVIYLIAGAAITTNTIRVDEVKFANNVANAVTSVLANGANGLATATQANPYTTNVPLPAAGQIYRTLADEGLWIEINMATPGGGTARLYGLDLVLEYNFN